ncbi:helix-turn-helix domain-containing protein [Thermomonospora catenispora]|uniref:helix-turn-helix domain-containing protein n=1 Tax=Thermomonospora catenispora TaxID=2493090 RepID=UPI001121CDB1|nr:helix-turn-helix transcriptional regulator [Thermomonospora catenispora]TNY38251.1 XRE family transcriptional regulator [Thermomonospora catenispora]
MTFGEKLRALMADREIGVRELARLVPYDPGNLSKVVNDRKNPSAKLAERLDEILNANGELIALRPVPPPRQLMNGNLTPDDAERIGSALARPSRLDRGVVNSLATVLAGQRRLEDAIGPGGLLVPVAGQLSAITSMLKEASGPHHRPLGRLVAEWTTYTGWLYAALRQDEKALTLFGRAEDLADEFEDGTIAALATSFRGYVARQQRRPCAVVRASMAALATPGGHPIQQTFDLLQAAQGYAALGETEQARKLLDQAADRAADRIEPPPPVYWYSEPFFQLNIGIVHKEIGEYGDAAELLRAGLDGMPADQRDSEWLDEYRDALTEAQERS